MGAQAQAGWQHDGSFYWRQSEVYALTSALVVGRRALWLVDPGYLPGDVADLRRMVDRLCRRQRPRARYLLLTHADFDHILGVHAFPEFKVVAAQAARRRLERGLRRGRLIDAGLLIDRPASAYQVFPIAEPVAGRTSALPGAILEPISSHTRDGLLGLLTGCDGRRILVGGDHLSALEGPHLTDWPGTLPSFEALAGLLAQADWLMVGHGPPARQAEARRRLRDDLSYLLGLLRLRAEGASETQALARPAPPGPSLEESRRYHRDNVHRLYRSVEPAAASVLARRLATLLEAL